MGSTFIMIMDFTSLAIDQAEFVKTAIVAFNANTQAKVATCH